MELAKIVTWLKQCGVQFNTGLSADELMAIEQIYDIHFPPDLKEFLALALPISSSFVN